MGDTKSIKLENILEFHRNSYKDRKTYLGKEFWERDRQVDRQAEVETYFGNNRQCIRACKHILLFHIYKYPHSGKDFGHNSSLYPLEFQLK